MKKTILIALLLALIPVFAFSSDWDEYQRYGTKGVKWDEYVKAGMGAFDSGNLGSAEMFFQRAIARGCNDGLVLAKIGLFYEAQNNYKKAADYFRKALKKLPTQYPSHEYTKLIDEMLGRTLFMLGNKAEAEEYLKTSIQKGENFTSLYLLGQIASEKKDTEGSITYMERALKASPPEQVDPRVNIIMMLQLGKAYYDKKEFETSLAWWNKVLSIDPANQVAQSYKKDIEQQKFKEEEKKVIQRIVQ